MIFLSLVSITCLIIAIWVRFSKDDKMLSKMKTDLLLAQKIANQAENRSLDLTAQLMAIKLKTEQAFEKAQTADYIAHSAKMDAARVQKHSLTIRLPRTKKKSDKAKVIDKIKSQLKDFSQ